MGVENTEENLKAHFNAKNPSKKKLVDALVEMTLEEPTVAEQWRIRDLEKQRIILQRGILERNVEVATAQYNQAESAYRGVRNAKGERDRTTRMKKRERDEAKTEMDQAKEALEEFNRDNPPQARRGRGLKKVICGRGIQPTPKPERYRQFGKYVIHMPSLKNNKLNLKWPSLGYIPHLPAQHISDDMKDFILDLLDTERITPHLYNALTKEEKSTFDRIAKMAGIDEVLGIKIENLEQREAMKRFEVLRGEMIAGNDNEDLRKELKRYLVSFINDGIIPRREGTNLLIEMMAMG